MASDNNPYSADHEPVDLTKMLHQPTVSDSGRDLSDASSQSPQSQARGGADPTNIGPGNVRMGMK